MRLLLVVLGLVVAGSLVAARPQAGGLECSVCKDLVSLAEKEIVSNSSEARIQEAIQDACAILDKAVPAAKAVCEYAEHNTDQIIHLILLKYDPEKVCEMINQCTPTNPVPVSANPVECLACKQFVSIAEKELTSNSTETRIKQVIDETCEAVEKYIPEVKAFCQMADDNVDKILKLLIAKYNSTEICTLIGKCGSKTFLPPLPQPHKTRDTCTACQGIVGLVQDSVKARRSEAEIRSVVEATCKVLKPSMPSIQTECDHVLEYLPAVINLLESIPPKHVCALFGTCGEFSPTVQALSESPALDKCDLCKMLLDQIQQQLKKNVTEDQIVSFITKTCSGFERVIPSIKEQCDFAISSIRVIIQDLNQGMTPEEVCTIGDQCQSEIVLAIADALRAGHIA